MSNPAQAPIKPTGKLLVLVGAGGNHIRLLRSLARHAASGLRIVVVSADSHYWHAPRLGDWLMGAQRMEQLAFPIDALIRAAGARQLTDRIQALDVDKHRLLLASGEVLHYDALSVEVGGECDREALEAALPGSTEHALWLQPMTRFTALWPKMAELMRAESTSVAVLGDGLLATSLALGLQQAIAADPLAKPFRVSLISGAKLPLAHSPARLQSRVLALLKSRQITVLQDRCVGLDEGEAQLGCGARLACDAALVALMAPFPSWAMRSHLAKHPSGLLELDEQGQSSSHARVIFSRFQAIDAGAQSAFELECNLLSVLGLPQDPGACAPSGWGSGNLSFLSTGPGKALACWHEWCMGGRLAWHLTHAMSERALRRSDMRAPLST